MIVNDDFSQRLFPTRIFPRSETVDFQRGEVDWRGGNIYFNINEIDKSISAYEKFIKKSSGDNDLVVLAYVGLGYCYEAKGNLKKALKSLDNSIKYCTVGSSYEGIIYRNMGRIYEEMNDSPKAVEYYKKALKLTIDPSMEMLIKSKISTLG